MDEDALRSLRGDECAPICVARNAAEGAFDATRLLNNGLQRQRGPVGLDEQHVAAPYSPRSVHNETGQTARGARPG